jgi:hypothetical protein
MMHWGSVLMVAIAIVGSTASLAVAGPRRGIHSPVQVKLETFLGPIPDGARPEATWRIKVGSGSYDLQVMKLIVLTGNTSPMRIFEAVRPTQGQFKVVGKDADLEAIKSAKPGEPRTIIAHLRLDAWTLMVSQVE